MANYDPKSLRAEEFINHEEILATLAYAQEHKNDVALIDAILEKARPKPTSGGVHCEGLTHREAAVLLACEIPEKIQEMYRLAEEIKLAFYGNRIVIFAPLYLSNYCVNGCVYCPYHLKNKHITRKKLTQDEIRQEVIALQDMGHKRLAIEAGEDPVNNPIEYILECLETIYSVKHKNGAIRRVNVNIAATTVENYRKLKDAGIGTYILFQETYHKQTYETLHPTGPKHDYAYHTEAMDRAMEGGIDDVGCGVLFGLELYRYEFTGLLMHAEHLEAVFGVGPHTISVPRIRRADDIDPSTFDNGIDDDTFAKIVACIRIAVPYTGMIVSTRESKACRERVLHLGISQISGGSRTSVGGYYEPEPEDGSQFDGGIERAKDLGNGRFALPGFGFTEKPGVISFVDREVKRSGAASLRFECAPTDPEHPLARARIELKVKPYTRYQVGMWWKTEGMDRTWGLQATYYTVPKKGEANGRAQQLTFTNPRIAETADWTYMTSDLSSLAYDRIQLWFGSWKSRQGRFWIDDITVRVAGLDDVLRREGCPFEVKGAASGVVYEEGRDYAPVPPMGKAQRALPRENGSIVLALPAGSRIRPGERLQVSCYRRHRMKGNSQVNVCMSAPRLYELVDESAKCLAEIVRPKKWFLPQDEIRAGGSCALCADPRRSMADLFANCVGRMHATIRRYTPGAKIYMWGDQIDPNMNGKVVPMMCKGSFAGSVDRIPKDIVVMHWGGRVPETLEYFREKGFETARSISGLDGQWDAKKAETARRNISAAKGDPNCHAVMFTTWTGDYSNLPRLAEFCK